MPNRLRGWDYASPGEYFVTVCTHLRRPLFGVVEDEVVRHSRLGRDVASQLVEVIGNRQGLCLDAFVVMPDHVHMIIGQGAEPASTHRVDWAVGQFKGRTTRLARERAIVASGAPLWQRGFFDRVVRSTEEHAALTEYIETNPLRWTLSRMPRRSVP